MHSFRNWAVGLSVGAAMAFGTAAQADPVANNAESIRKLNIMLMVTSLRCRSGEHAFESEYRRFNVAHQGSLEAAHRHLKRQMSATHGEREQQRALDRLGVSVANSYGNGHPWLDCAGLKQATTELTMSQDRQRLADMAGVLLARQEPRFAADESEATIGRVEGLAGEEMAAAMVARWSRN